MDKSSFANKPFTNFHKMDEKAKQHQSTKYHNDNPVAVEKFKDSVTRPELNIARNRYNIRCVPEAVLYCGPQCVA